MTNKKIISAAVAMGILTISSVSVTAEKAIYPEAGKATSHGKVGFKKGETEVTDPTDPDNPVTPIDPGNDKDGDLKIQYVSDFEFETIKKTVNEIYVLGTADRVKEIANNNEEKLVPAFVSTLDMRTDRDSGWTLTVEAQPFKTATHELKGGEVILSNGHYAQFDEKSPVVFSDVASTDVKNGAKLTPGTAVKIASADASKDQGIGSYSLAFGEVSGKEEGRSTGVTFHMPEKTAVETSTYKTTFDWNLTPTLDIK